MNRYYVVLSRGQDEPDLIHLVPQSNVVIFENAHPSPNQIREIFKEFPMYAFAFLYKGYFTESSKSGSIITKHQLIRKYNCSSFGISDRTCKSRL
jgi:hypothetical protein